MGEFEEGQVKLQEAWVVGGPGVFREVILGYALEVRRRLLEVGA